MPRDASSRTRRSLAEIGAVRYGGALATVGTILGLAMLLRASVDLPDLEMLFLLAVMITAMWFGRGPSVLAAAVGVGAYNFFFVPPLYTFSVADRRFLLTFLMMFAVGIVMSELTHRLRAQGREAVAREARTQALSIERAKLAEEARVAGLRAKTEEIRSSLLSVVSHDLRTPLASITGAATVLRDDEKQASEKLDPETRRELLTSIVSEAERLERLVGNILDMTRLEASGVSIKRDWVALDELIGSALTRLEERLGDREIVVEVSADLPLFLADPVLLEQLLMNLLENAEKYTPAKSTIEVHASVVTEGVRIEVMDSGPGFAPGTEAELFEKFFRGASGGTQGVGLGLSICKAVALAHGGTIAASNRPEGGALFTITLPVGVEPAVESAPALSLASDP